MLSPAFAIFCIVLVAHHLRVSGSVLESTGGSTNRFDLRVSTSLQTLTLPQLLICLLGCILNHMRELHGRIFCAGRSYQY